jgi:hypothetical protein
MAFGSSCRIRQRSSTKACACGYRVDLLVEDKLIISGGV